LLLTSCPGMHVRPCSVLVCFKLFRACVSCCFVRQISLLFVRHHGRSPSVGLQILRVSKTHGNVFVFVSCFFLIPAAHLTTTQRYSYR
jgi:hypothetical protein